MQEFFFQFVNKIKLRTKVFFSTLQCTLASQIKFIEMKIGKVWLHKFKVT
jgi:hypothetical protein